MATINVKDAGGNVVAIPVLPSNDGTALPVSGSVQVSNTVPVSGTFFPATQPVSLASAPLAAGASTEATLVLVKNAVTGTLAVSAAALPLPAGAATATAQAAQTTALQALASSSTYALVSPSDSVALTATTRAITVGGAGNLTVKRPDGTSVGPIPVVAGQTLAIAAAYIMATGTTATGLLAQF